MLRKAARPCTVGSGPSVMSSASIREITSVGMIPSWSGESHSLNTTWPDANAFKFEMSRQPAVVPHQDQTAGFFR
jgi:hypothetical protein